MNMIMHDVHYKRFDIKNEDTLERPQHYDMRFEAIVANPPFSAKWTASPLFMNDERFSAYGKLAPSSKADFAFVQHMLHQLDENGTMAIVLPHGVLFRGGAEGHIREYLIKEKNCLDAVIGLPANIFYGTGIPTCILVLKKKRTDAKSILFIDASQHYEKVKTQNVLRTEDIDKIISTYENRTEEEKYSYIADLNEVANNDYNLNIPRYVDTFEEEEEIVLDNICSALKKLSDLSHKNDEILKKQCDILQIPFPNGHNISLLHQYKKGVMQQLFSGKLRFKDENGKDYPDWEEKRLGDVGSIISGLTYSPDDINEDGILVLRSSNVQNRRLSFQDNVYVKTSAFNPVKLNDILICVRNGSKHLIGKNTIIDKETAGVAFGAFMSVYRSEYNLYIFHYFDTDEYKNEVHKNLGATINSINGSDLKNFKIPFPSIEEQQKIANFLSSVDAKIESTSQQINQTQSFKKGLLQQMFV